MSLPNTFTNGTAADATEVNANFVHVYKKFLEFLPAIGGTGADGDINSVGNITLDRGKVYNYDNFTLNSGHVLTVANGSASDPTIIKVQGNCVIAGTVNLKGKGLSGGTGNAAGVAGSGTAGDGLTNFLNGGAAGNYIGGGTTGARGGGGGTGSYANGSDAPSGDGIGGLMSIGMVLSINNCLCGAGGGGGGGSTVGRAGNGGAGGGSIIFEIEGNLTITGTIDVSGEDGESITESGGGGGGGGAAILYCNGSVTSGAGTFTFAGGAGGVAGAAGRNGGAGGSGKIVIVSGVN